MIVIARNTIAVRFLSHAQKSTKILLSHDVPFSPFLSLVVFQMDAARVRLPSVANACSANS